MGERTKLFSCVSHPYSAHVENDIPFVSMKGNIRDILDSIDANPDILEKKYVKDVLMKIEKFKNEFLPHKFDAIRLTWDKVCLLEIDNMHNKIGRAFAVSVSKYKKLTDEQNN